MDAPRRVLFEGLDVSTWPTLKVAYADARFDELFGAIRVWNAGGQYVAPVRISDDRLAVELTTPVGVRPPVEAWELVFADAIHNLRAALDAMVWDLAHLDGGVPQRPRQVAMPVTRDEKSWNSAAKNLESVPTEFLERMREIQPWVTAPEQMDQHWLSILAELDNAAKHRGTLQLLPRREGINIEFANVQRGENIDEAKLEYLTNARGCRPGGSVHSLQVRLQARRNDRGPQVCSGRGRARSRSSRSGGTRVDREDRAGQLRS